MHKDFAEWIPNDHYNYPSKPSGNDVIKIFDIFSMKAIKFLSFLLYAIAMWERRSRRYGISGMSWSISEDEEIERNSFEKKTNFVMEWVESEEKYKNRAP